MKKIISFLCICLFTVLTGQAQTYDYTSFKEKIYLHTSHVFFQPGDEMFFKLYLVNAKDQQPSSLSKVAFVDILDPSGKVLKKLSYKITDGYAEGSFYLEPSIPGGIYRLKAYTSWMRNENDSTFYVKEITVQQVIPPRVLMKLDFPKKGYGPGDEVTADYSIRNLSDQPIAGHAVNYKVSIGGAVIQTGTATTGSNGKAQLQFRLPADLASTDGLLNVTIDYDAYKESISRSIPIVLNKIDLQLLPEGGTLVAGLTSNIAFRAVNDHGKPADIKGAVLDHTGRQVTTFESYYAGMGKFSFKPLAGEKYTVKIISPLHIAQVYDFPACRSEGVVMNVIKKDGKTQLELSATADQQVTLTGQTKAVTCYTKALPLKKGVQTIDIDESLFPAGIARFTLLLHDKTPVAERLVFLNRNKVLQVSVTTDKKEYLPREKVKMTIKTTDDKGTPLPSNLSVAVMDDKLWTYADDKQDHILSWLLMSSELHGKIEEPLFYFKEDEPRAAPALDLVMLTHGYRYFDYIPEAKSGELLKYIPDEGQVLSGTVLNAKKEPVRATVFLINTSDNGKAIQMNTDDDGAFFFTNLEPLSRYCLIARPVKGRAPVTIRIEQNGVEANQIRARKLLEKGVVLHPTVQPLPVVPEKKEDANAVMNMVKIEDAKALDEVIVVGYGTQKKKSVAGAVMMVRGEELAVNNLQGLLQGRVAGVQVVPRGNPGAPDDIRIRGHASLTGNNQPLFVVDGVAMEGLDMQLNPNDIASIEVIKDAGAVAIYGVRGANGVIVIHTKNKLPGRIRFDLGKRSYYATMPVPANQTTFSVARRFYAPHYATTDTDERTDFRETIYWNPVVQTDKEGMATLEFYNSDAATTFRAVAEGIGWNGRPGRAEATWATRNALQIDAKIPPYLTIGDQAMVPLVLKNNSASAIQLDISISVPVNMSAGRFEDKVTLPPNSSRQVLIPLEAIAPTSGTVKFTVHGKSGTETLALPIAAAQRGFPVVHTFSGETSAQHTFIISEPVKGSIQTKLQVFTSLEGQLLDGIESMLREPYGCFEQTSSSTYPNIFILKYLKESGKPNREVEAKALEYIEAGYKKLIAFETAMGGFEWFGHTPPHEALTAYGLLEFTDMQAFIDVDKNMLARTKSFLLSRRDGEGGFKLAAGGYDRFRSVPNNIANLYIVYALTQAGAGSEIQREYNAGVQKALASGDGYQLGLMALAAANMKDTTGFARLMAALKENYRKENLAAATSVVNSRDASLRVEALSLYAMSLAREQHPDMAAIAIAISKILSEKVYYGYGSTQATVLALNAIVEYVKLKGRAESSGTISFHLNNEPLEAARSFSDAVKTGSNTFAVQYSGQAGLPYNMELSYFTMQPPGSAAAELQLHTALSDTRTKAGETVRMNIDIKNIKSTLQPMAIAKIGIPAGLSLQPWQLKELAEKKEVAYYEIFDNYLVLYWMGFAAGETKSVHLDLKADVPGKYKGKASNCYLYYTPEHKNWQEGTAIEIMP